MISGLLTKLRSILPTTNVHLIGVNTKKNSAVCTSKSLPALFQIITHKKQLFKLLKEITHDISKLETVDALKQNTEKTSLLKSYRQQFSCQSQRVLRPVFKNTCSLPHQIKAYRKKSKLELLDAEKLIEGRKLKKKLDFEKNLNKESRKSPLPSKSWVMIICVQ